MKDIDGGKIPESAFKLLRWVSFLHFLGVCTGTNSQTSFLLL